MKFFRGAALLFILLFFGLGTVSAANIQLYVQVTDSATSNAVSGAAVTVTYRPTGNVNTYTTDSNGKTSTFSLPENNFIDVSVVAAGYQNFVSTSNTGNTATDTQPHAISVTMVSTGSSSGAKYITDEKIVPSGDCGSGYTQTYSFTDGVTGSVVKHCIKFVSTFSPGTYVNSSYVQLDTGVPETRCGGCQSCRVGQFFSNVPQQYNFCVTKGYVSAFDTGKERIVIDAKMAAECEEKHNFKEGPIAVTSGGVYHCTQVFNDKSTPLNPAGACELRTAVWVNDDGTQITEAEGRENGVGGTRVYPWVTTNEGCSDKKIVFNIYEDEVLKETLQAEKSSGEFVFYKAWYPIWADKASPTFQNNPIYKYKYTARIEGEAGNSLTSGILTVRKPTIECETDNDCENNANGPVCDSETKKCRLECKSNADCVEDLGTGYVCNEGKCRSTETEDCRLSNPGWRGENGNILLEGSSVRAWDFGNSSKRDGEQVAMYVERTESCAGQEVTFNVYEDDYIKDDLVPESVGRKYFAAIWKPEWPASGFFSFLLGGFNEEYYFIARIYGDSCDSNNDCRAGLAKCVESEADTSAKRCVLVESTPSDLITLRAPEDRACYEGKECAEGTTCDSSGNCVPECSTDDDCTDEVCFESQCVVCKTDEDCDDGKECNIEHECGEGDPDCEVSDIIWKESGSEMNDRLISNIVGWKEGYNIENLGEASLYINVQQKESGEGICRDKKIRIAVMKDNGLREKTSLLAASIPLDLTVLGSEEEGDTNNEVLFTNIELTDGEKLVWDEENDDDSAKYSVQAWIDGEKEATIKESSLITVTKPICQRNTDCSESYSCRQNDCTKRASGGSGGTGGNSGGGSPLDSLGSLLGSLGGGFGF